MAEATPKPKKQKRDWNAEGSLPYEKIPAFKAAFDFYKECQFRFRNVPVDAKPTAREVKTKVMRVMVLIAHARLNIRVRESLQEAVFLAIEAQITLRVLVETNALTKRISPTSHNTLTTSSGRWWAGVPAKSVRQQSLLTCFQPRNNSSLT